MRNRVGLLLVQLGTPSAPTAAAVRPYLRQFLSDPRVIEVPRPIWWLILNLFILPFRPRASAEKYARVWSAETGSPLLHYSRRQRELLAAELGDDFQVELGMTYGEPSIQSSVDHMAAAGVDRLVVLPMFPQYAASTTASALDATLQAVLDRRLVPSVRVVPPYHLDPGYLDAATAIALDHRASLDPAPEHTVITFHGLPKKMVDAGDPYAEQCRATAAELERRLGLGHDEWTLTFQSRFGRAEWLQPYTEETLCNMARSGTRRVQILTPGFTADCLETIDEIGYEAAEAFRGAGGERLDRAPCLNDDPRWIAAMAGIVRREASGWVD